MVQGDYDEVVALWRTTEGVGLSEGDDQAGIEQYLRRNPGLCFVAHDSTGKLIGAVLCGHDGRRGYMYHLAVAQNARNQGLGRKLVESCLTALRLAGIQKCTIFVFAHNAEGKKFWHKLDWKERADLQPMQVSISTAPPK